MIKIEQEMDFYELLKHNKVTQKRVAEVLSLSEQTINKMFKLPWKQWKIGRIVKVLESIGYKLQIDLQPK